MTDSCYVIWCNIWAIDLVVLVNLRKSFVEELTKYGFAVVEPEIKCNWNPDASDLNKAEELVSALLA